jgi:excisionase family DNA binding protein
MSTRKRHLTRNEIARAFSSAGPTPSPVMLSPAQLAALTGLSVKTIYAWIAAGRLDGAFRKRGKHIRFWRDRAIEIFFNGKDWNHDR